MEKETLLFLPSFSLTFLESLFSPLSLSSSEFFSLFWLALARISLAARAALDFLSSSSEIFWSF